MPLPPAPPKRAALLPAQAYEAPVRSSHKDKAARKPESAPALAPAKATSGPAQIDNLDLPEDVAALTDDAQAETMAEAVIPPARRRPATASPAPQAEARPRKAKARTSGPTKLFVLDTNVLMHDPMCLFRFEEHDIFLPMIVLEELDGHKKGMTEVARNARQASR